MSLKKMLTDNGLIDIFIKYDFIINYSKSMIRAKKKIIEINFRIPNYNKNIITIDHNINILYGKTKFDLNREIPTDNNSLIKLKTLFENEILPEILTYGTILGLNNKENDFILKELMEKEGYLSDNKINSLKNFPFPTPSGFVDIEFTIKAFIKNDKKVIFLFKQENLYLCLINDKNDKKYFHWTECAKKENSDKNLVCELINFIKNFNC